MGARVWLEGPTSLELGQLLRLDAVVEEAEAAGRPAHVPHVLLPGHPGQLCPDVYPAQMCRPQLAPGAGQGPSRLGGGRAGAASPQTRGPAPPGRSPLLVVLAPQAPQMAHGLVHAEYVVPRLGKQVGEAAPGFPGGNCRGTAGWGADAASWGTLPKPAHVGLGTGWDGASHGHYFIFS